MICIYIHICILQHFGGCLVLRCVLRHFAAARGGLRTRLDWGSRSRWTPGVEDGAVPPVAEHDGCITLGGARSLPWSSRMFGLETFFCLGEVAYCRIWLIRSCGVSEFRFLFEWSIQCARCYVEMLGEFRMFDTIAPLCQSLQGERNMHLCRTTWRYGLSWRSGRGVPEATTLAIRWSYLDIVALSIWSALMFQQM